MVSKIKHGIIISLCFFLVACQLNTADSATCRSLVSDIPPERLNADLILSTPEGKKNFTIQEDLWFLADNYSQEILETMPDKDLEVYLWNGSEWVRIKNKLDYLSKVDRFGVKSPDDPGGHTYHVFYDTSLIQRPTRACIILRAIKGPENARLAIGSYIEIEIRPSVDNIDL